MAWIKIDHVTPDKPEIVNMAEKLKMDQDAVFGKCVRIWIWADQQMIDGSDLPVTTSFLDRLTNCPGFAAALVEIGWLKSRNGRISIPHFDRHNGQSAKNRALSTDRMKRQRYDQIVTSSSPDKIREEKKKRVRGVLAHVDPGNLPPAKQDPENLQATRSLLKAFSPPSEDEVRDYCRSRGNDVSPGKFVAHYQSKGWMVGKNKMKDWKAAVHTWEESNRDRQASQPQREFSLQPDFIRSGVE